MKRHEQITVDDALIMALKMHRRGDCNLLQALPTGVQLRWQINFLSELGIDRKRFERLLTEVASGDVKEAWD